jgi:hypothetical protein
MHSTERGSEIAELHNEIHGGISDLATKIKSRSELPTLAMLLDKTVRAKE